MRKARSDEPPAQPPEPEVQRAMRELAITEEMLDRRPGQRAMVDHGDYLVFHLLIRRPGGGHVHRQKTWPRPGRGAP